MGRKDIPPLPENLASDLRWPLSRMREEVQKLIGTVGDGSYAALTSSSSGGSSIGGGTTTPPGGGTSGEIDLTPPPTPTFESVDAGFSRVIIQWSGIGYTQGHGHGQTIIYGVQKDPSDPTLPTFPGDAGIVGAAPNALTIYALPSELNTRWHLWLKFKTVDGVESVTPAGGTNGFNVAGVYPTTGQDIAQLLEVIAGSITETELFASLNDRIDLIDNSVAGSVNARILAASDAAAAALLAEVNALEMADDAINGSLALEVDARTASDGVLASTLGVFGTSLANATTGIYNERTLRSDADSAQAAQVTTLIAATGQSLAAIAVEQDVRTTADLALATQVSGLIATFGTGGTGDPVNAAAIFTEQEARASADAAQASQIVGLTAAVGHNVATITNEQIARATADETLAQQSLQLSAAVADNSAALAIEQQVRTTADSASSSQITSLGATTGVNTAALQVEQTTRAAADAASASTLSVLAVRVGSGESAAAAAISMEQTARADADDALASEVVSLGAAFGSNLAAIRTETTTRATADSASASIQTVLAADVAGNRSAIFSEQAVRSTADSTQASQIGAVTAVASGIRAGVTSETLARVAADSAQASQIGSVNAVTSVLAAGVTSESIARADADTAQAAQIGTLTASGGALAATIINEQTARIDGDSANASQITTLQSSVRMGTSGSLLPSTFEEGTTYWTNVRDGDPATIATAAGTKITNDASFGTCLEITTFTAAGNNILTKGVVPATAGRKYRVTARFKVTGGDGSAQFNLIIEGQSVSYTLANVVTLSTTTAATGTVMEITATISNVASTGVSAWPSGAVYLRPGLRLNAAEVGLVVRVQSIKIEDVTAEATLMASIQTLANTTASVDGSILAQYMTKLDVNGFVSGFGLMSSLVAGGTPTSTFIVNVDRFAVATPTTSVAGWSASNAVTLNQTRRIVGVDDKVLVCKKAGTTGGSAPSIAGAIGSLVTDGTVTWQIGSRIPFSVLTSATTINGVSVPAGSYFDGAYMLNATIGKAQIALLAVDDALIANLSAAKLTVGDGTVGGNLKSTTYTAGSGSTPGAGWLLQPNGSVFFQNATVYGTIYAQAADIQGTLSANQINGRGLVIRRQSDNAIILDANEASPPWVVGGTDAVTLGGGIPLTDGLSGTNTLQIRSVQAGAGMDISESGGVLTFASKSSDDSAIRLPADLSTSSTTVGNASGMALSMEANSSYRIEGTVIYRAAAATTGIKLGASIPSTATGALRITANTAETTQESRVLHLPTGGSLQSVSMSGTWAAQPGSPTVFSATADTIASFEGVINTGASAGSFQLAFASEVGGSSITMRAGTVVLAERVTNVAASTVFNLNGSPGFGSFYYASATNTNGKPTSARRTITLDESGGWTVTTGGSWVVGSGTPTSGSWSSPTGAGAGTQWQVLFEATTSTGDATVSNGAPTYQALSSPRSISATVYGDHGGVDGMDTVVVTIRLRNVTSGAVTTLPTITLDLDATSFF